mgnify:CR=1 FL=1
MRQILIQVYEMTLNCLLLQHFFLILDSGIADYLANPPQAILVGDAAFMWKEKKRRRKIMNICTGIQQMFSKKSK